MDGNTAKVTNNVDRWLIEKHLPLVEMAKNMLKNGMSAAEMIEGVRINHGDFIRLVELAQKAERTIEVVMTEMNLLTSNNPMVRHNTRLVVESHLREFKPE